MMTLKEAIAIAKDRNGHPREDDWDLAEAAMVLAKSAIVDTQKVLAAYDAGGYAAAGKLAIQRLRKDT